MTDDAWEALRERLAEHVAEWRGDEVLKRVTWVCTCQQWRGDRFSDFQAHQADALLPVVEEQVRAEKAAGMRAGVRHALYMTGMWCGDCDPAVDQGCCPINGKVRAALADDREGGEGRAPLPSTCQHGYPEGECATCEACAACDGSCGVCPYVPRTLLAPTQGGEQ